MNLASQTLHSILRAAAQMLEKLDAETLNNSPAPGKWSPKQVLGHLIDSAYNNHRRFVIAADQDHLRFDGYDQEAWVERNGYHVRDAHEVVETFLAVQRNLAYLLANLPDELMNRKTRDHALDRMAMRAVEPGSESCLGFVVEDYLFHLVHHLRQIDPAFTAEWHIGYQQEADDYRLS